MCCELSQYINLPIYWLQWSLSPSFKCSSFSRGTLISLERKTGSREKPVLSSPLLPCLHQVTSTNINSVLQTAGACLSGKCSVLPLLGHCFIWLQPFVMRHRHTEIHKQRQTDTHTHMHTYTREAWHREASCGHCFHNALNHSILYIVFTLVLTSKGQTFQRAHTCLQTYNETMWSCFCQIVNMERNKIWTLP